MQVQGSNTWGKDDHHEVFLKLQNNHNYYYLEFVILHYNQVLINCFWNY
jgi:hypothetical protein